MKKLIIALIAIAGLFNAADQAQAGDNYKQLTMTRGTSKTDIITVPAGTVFKEVYLGKKGGVTDFNCYFFIQIGGTEFDIGANNCPDTVVGPATIKAATNSQSDFWLVYQILPFLLE